jgi:arylformamidase
MPYDVATNRTTIARRTMVIAAAAGVCGLVQDRAVAQQPCLLGPPPHEKGAKVFLDYDQVELDAAYDQRFYAPLLGQILKRFSSNSDAARARIGQPRRESYGPTDVERLDIYPTKRAKAPIFIYLHGGAWLPVDAAKNYGFVAEMFVNAGAHFVAPEFISVDKAGGDLQVMADQICRAIAWTYKNARSFDGDPNRLFIGGHSSGGHLCGVALVTDWKSRFDLPADTVKGGLCMSGMYDLKPVRLSARSSYVKFTDEMEQAMSSQRHLDLLRAPIIVTYGTNETPEFQRQNRDFAAAVKAAGKSVQLIEAANYNHFEMAESLGNPYGPNGRAALTLMNLG